MREGMPSESQEEQVQETASISNQEDQGESDVRLTGTHSKPGNGMGTGTLASIMLAGAVASQVGLKMMDNAVEQADQEQRIEQNSEYSQFVSQERSSLTTELFQELGRMPSDSELTYATSYSINHKTETLREFVQEMKNGSMSELSVLKFAAARGDTNNLWRIQQLENGGG